MENKLTRYEVKHYVYLPEDKEAEHYKLLTSYCFGWPQFIEKFYIDNFGKDYSDKVDKDLTMFRPEPKTYLEELIEERFAKNQSELFEKMHSRDYIDNLKKKCKELGL